VSKLEYTIPYTCAFSVVTALPRNAFMIGSSIVNKDIRYTVHNKKERKLLLNHENWRGEMDGEILGQDYNCICVNV
jgi:hypothetical protein